MTTSDNEYYNERQRVVQRVTTSDNEWQRVVEQMKANKSDFRFQNETTMQCKTTIYSAKSF